MLAHSPASARVHIHILSTSLYFADFDFLYSRDVQDPPKGAPKDHPQARVQIPFLSVFYLVHVKVWRFTRQFIACGGLRGLVPLIVSENPYVRSQAIDSFMTITSGCPDASFDWFEVPKDHATKVIHQRLFDLTNTDFLKNVLSNYDNSSGKSFPGASAWCLQILAFWLSWMRKLYCKDNMLRLSRELLDMLQRWSVRTDIAGEELELAKKLFEDFDRFPAAEDVSGHHVKPNVTMTTNPEAKTSRATTESSKAKGNSKGSGERVIISEVEEVEEDGVQKSSAELALEAKEKGNRCYANKNYDVAIGTLASVC